MNIKSKEEGNGIYAFVLEGDVEIEGEQLNKRDGIHWDTSSIKYKANEKCGSFTNGDTYEYLILKIILL